MGCRDYFWDHIEEKPLNDEYGGSEMLLLEVPCSLHYLTCILIINHWMVAPLISIFPHHARQPSTCSFTDSYHLITLNYLPVCYLFCLLEPLNILQNPHKVQYKHKCLLYLLCLAERVSTCENWCSGRKIAIFFMWVDANIKVERDNHASSFILARSSYSSLHLSLAYSSSYYNPIAPSLHHQYTFISLSAISRKAQKSRRDTVNYRGELVSLVGNLMIVGSGQEKLEYQQQGEAARLRQFRISRTLVKCCLMVERSILVLVRMVGAISVRRKQAVRMRRACLTSLSLSETLKRSFLWRMQTGWSSSSSRRLSKTARPIYLLFFFLACFIISQNASILSSVASTRQSMGQLLDRVVRQEKHWLTTLDSTFFFAYLKRETFLLGASNVTLELISSSLTEDTYEQECRFQGSCQASSGTGVQVQSEQGQEGRTDIVGRAGRRRLGPQSMKY